MSHTNEKTENLNSGQNREVSEDQISLIFNSLKDAIFTLDVEDLDTFRFSSANKQFLSNVGMEIQEVIGAVLEEVIPDDSVDLVKQKYREAIKSGESLRWEETMHLKPGTITGIVSVTPIFNKKRGCDQLIGSISDITERKNAEDSLKKVMDLSLDIICTIDKDGRFVKVSEASKKVWGYDPGELEGKFYMDLVYSEDQDLTREMHADLLGGVEVTDFENRYVKKDGTAVEMIWSVRWDDEEKLLYCVAKDATELKRAKREMELLINNTEESFILMDKNLKIISFNEQFGRLYREYFGIEVKKGESIINYAQSEQKEALKEVYKRVLSGENERTTITVPLSGDNKKIMYIRYKPARNERGEIIGAFVTTIDVTDEIEARQQLEESNERYEYVTQATSDAIWDFVPATGKLFWGEGFKTLFGYERGTGGAGIEKWMRNIHPEDIDAIEEEVEQLLSGNQTKWDQEYRFKKADGTYAFVRDKAIVIRDENGKPERVVGAIEDITQKKEEEQYLKLMEAVVTNTSDAVIITKAEPMEAPDGPEIVFVNEAFEKMTGYSRDEVIGKTPRILEGPDSDSEALKEFEEKLRRWETSQMEVINYKKNGNAFWVNFTMSPISNQEGEYTHWIAVERDITERKIREQKKAISADISLVFNRAGTLKEALDESIKQIAKLKNFAMAEFWLADRDKDVIRLTSHFALTDEMDIFYNIAGTMTTFKNGEGLPGKTWKKDKPLFWRNLQKRKSFIRNEAAKTGGLKTAFSFPVKDDDGLIGVLILGLDIDIKKERYDMPLFKDLAKQLSLEINRKQLEEELSRIFSSAPDVICVSGFDGYFRKINPAMCDLLGYTEEELLTTPINEFVHPDDRQKTIEEFASKREGDGKNYFENRYVTKSGEIVWFSWTSKLFYEEGISYSVAKDVTDQKELEELLDQANRLARIGSWELDLINSKIFWSDMTRKIHEEEPGFEPDLEASLNYYKEGEPREQIQQVVEEAMKHGTPWDLELPIITSKGNERWVRTIGEAEIIDGKTVRIYGSFQDIHEKKELEQLLDQANRLAKIGSWEINLVENKIYWSNITREILDVALDDEPSMEKALEIYKEGESRKNMTHSIEQAIEHGTPWDIEVQILTTSGTEKWVRSIGEADIADGKCVRLYGSLQDIHERKVAELAYKEALEKRNEILESIDDGFFSLNREWIVTYWNSKAEELLHTSKEKILGENFWDIFDDVVDLPSYKNYRKAMKEGVSVSFEEYYEPIDRWFDVNIYPSDDGISVYFKNITKRKENEENIRQINERFEKVTKATNDAIWDFDVQNENLYWGKGFDSLFGYDLEKTNPTQEFLISLIHPDDRERVIQKIKNYMSGASKTDWFEEYRFQREDGSYAYVMDRAVFIKNNNGEVIRIVGAMTDLTRQKEFEDSLKKLNIELEQRAGELAASNAELEQFAFVASHDLQEPLRMITGFLSQIEKKYGNVLDEKGKKYIHFATDGAKRMRQIILDLLEFSRIGRIDTEKETIELNSLIVDVLSLNKKLITESKAKIDVENLPEIYAAKSQIRQLFQNLINNAVKYQVKDNKPVVKISWKEDDEFWHFSVKDNGIGIKKEYSDKIFNIFQRLHANDEYGGSGVGLAICKKIVEDHGGTIEVDSAVGEGSTFYFNIKKRLADSTSENLN